ncbi:hypothetical protein [Luteolibacter soli]|uniref:Uncharacterized protein n=1 Tax=Luteolibacter soli TaxID=3135280 RepID=A0ABU9B167_9BACT
MLSDSNERAPFLVPFIVALLLGIPASILWHFVSTQYGLLVSGITILLGLSCGLGARFAGSGYHPAGSAIIATMILIVINISITTILVMSVESGQPVLATLQTLVSHGSFTDFANQCAIVGGNTFIRYPVALYAAYLVSDAS